MTYGDAEPEDAWHPDDDVLVLLDNLDRRCTQLGEPRTAPDTATPIDWLIDISLRLGRIRTRDLDTRDLHRTELIGEDIDYLRGRLEGG